MKRSQYGPCGLFCGACGATDCGGCRSDLIDDWVRQCKFRKCAGERHIDFCCYCSEYPCGELSEFMHDKWPHHWTMAPNLEYIRNNGSQKWLQAQRQEWSCDDCGAARHWYQKSCPCGREFKCHDLPE